MCRADNFVALSRQKPLVFWLKEKIPIALSLFTHSLSSSHSKVEQSKSRFMSLNEREEEIVSF